MLVNVLQKMLGSKPVNKALLVCPNSRYVAGNGLAEARPKALR